MTKIRKFNILFLAVILGSFLFDFSSCSNISSSESGSGSVSFVLGPEVFKAALTGANRSYTENGILRNENTEWILEKIQNTSYKMEISIKGEYIASAEKTWSAEDIIKEINLEKIVASEGEEEVSLDELVAKSLSKTAKFEFSGIPIGKSVYAECRFYSTETYEYEGEVVEDSKKSISALLLHGKSEEKSISSGINNLTLSVYNAYAEFKFNVTFEFDEDTNIETILENSSNFSIYPFALDDSFVSGLYKAYDDELELYEAANKYYSQENHNMGYTTAPLYDGQSSKINETSIAVEGSMRVPVSIANKNIGDEITIVPLYFKWDDSPKAKYVGLKTPAGAKTTIVPKKNETNKITIKMKSLTDIIDTQNVLYNRVVSDMGYSTYKFEAGYGIYETNKGSFCFDKDGNIYFLNNTYAESGMVTDSAIKSTRTGFEDIKLSDALEGTSDDGAGIVVDLATNIMYGYETASNNLYIYKYPNLISDISETSDTTVKYTITGADDDTVPCRCYIYNGIVYIITQATMTEPNDYALYILELKNGNISYELKSGGDQSAVINLGYGSSFAKISDMLYQDGALYLLVSDYRVPNNVCGSAGGGTYESYPIYSRGAVLRVNLSDNTFKAIGYIESPTDSKTGFFNVCESNGNGNIWYKDEALTQAVTVGYTAGLGADVTKTGNANFEKVFTPIYASAASSKASALSSKNLCGPRKFIAIKPKKLVIADDGVAFYTDALGAWTCTNSNRIVTVDLENFVIDSVEETSATFEETQKDNIGDTEFFVIGSGVAGNYWYKDADNNNNITNPSRDGYPCIKIEE